MDVLPTVLSLTGVGLPEGVPIELDGSDLSPLLRGGQESELAGDGAIVENDGAGTIKPVRAVAAWADGPRGRRRYKYIYVHGFPEQLYDLVDDPDEWRDLSTDGAHAEVLARLRERVMEGWDPADVEQRVVASQRVRDFVKRALGAGEWTPWDYRPEFEFAKGRPVAAGRG